MSNPKQKKHTGLVFLFFLIAIALHYPYRSLLYQILYKVPNIWTFNDVTALDRAYHYTIDSIFEAPFLKFLACTLSSLIGCGALSMIWYNYITDEEHTFKKFVKYFLVSVILIGLMFLLTLLLGAVLGFAIGLVGLYLVFKLLSSEPVQQIASAHLQSKISRIDRINGNYVEVTLADGNTETFQISENERYKLDQEIRDRGTADMSKYDKNSRY